MTPFPSNFGIPKFDKYKGCGDPQEHIQEIYIVCMEVSYNDTYLMHLFPWSLGGQEIKCFSHLPLDIKTFWELVDKFVAHFSYNIEHEATLNDV